MKNNSYHGSVIYRKERNRWMAQYYIKNYITGKMEKKRKNFMTKKEAEDYLKAIEYQKEDPIFIEKNGIPLVEIMKLKIRIIKTM